MVLVLRYRSATWVVRVLAIALGLAFALVLSIERVPFDSRPGGASVQESPEGAPPVPSTPASARLGTSDPRPVAERHPKSRPQQDGPGAVPAPTPRSLEWAIAHADELGLPNLTACRVAAGRLVECGECIRNEECAAGAACAVNWATRRTECFDNECTVDDDCPADRRCLALSGSESGHGVHRCAPAGVRGVGEQCDTLRRTSESTCGDGLVCTLGSCREPCDDAGACSGDESCIGDYDGWGCVSTRCADVHCPKDFRCLEGRCLKGPDCRDPQACPPGTACMARGDGERWTSACLQPCSEARSCPDGEVCDAFGACLPACDPERLDSCGNDSRCQSVDGAGAVWGCEPG